MTDLVELLNYLQRASASPEEVEAASTIEALSERIDVLETRAREAYEEGFRNGFVEAHVNDLDGFPDEAAVLSKLSGVSLAEGWDAFNG